MNLIKSVLRSLYRFKYYTLLNLFGLILGLSCSLVLFLYVRFEFSYDEFHRDKERIFRVSEILTSPQKKEMYPVVRIPVGPDMKEAFAEIEDFTRVTLNSQGKLLKFGDKSISIKKSLYTDANFFHFFSFGLKLGDPRTVLIDKNSIILTEEVADRLFGDQNPVGTTITCNNQSFVVSGIAKNAPVNSHIRFDVVLPIEPLITAPNVYISWNGGMSASTFLKLQHPGQQTALAGKLANFLWKKINKANKASGFFHEFVLEPLPKIHIYSQVDWDMFNKKKYSNVMTLFFIGLIVLIIAIVNYLFISNGTLALRSKEFGIKHYLGIGKYGIIRQIFAETFMLFLVSGLFAVLLLLILRPNIAQLFDNEFVLSQLLNNWPYLILVITGISSVISLIQFICIRSG